MIELDARAVREALPAADFGGGRLPGFGPVQHLTEQHTVLSFGADLMDLALVHGDPARDGTMLTISIAAHHRTPRARRAVPADAALVWLPVLVGDAWMPFFEADGDRYGTTNRISTEYHRLFLSPTGQPTPSQTTTLHRRSVCGMAIPFAVPRAVALARPAAELPAPAALRSGVFVKVEWLQDVNALGPDINSAGPHVTDAKNPLETPA